MEQDMSFIKNSVIPIIIMLVGTSAKKYTALYSIVDIFFTCLTILKNV